MEPIGYMCVSAGSMGGVCVCVYNEVLACTLLEAEQSHVLCLQPEIAGNWWPAIRSAVSPKAWEPGESVVSPRPRAEGDRRSQAETGFSLPSPMCSIQALSGLAEAHPPWGGTFALLSVPIQKRITSRNTLTETSRNNIWSYIWASYGPVKLTHRTNDPSRSVPLTKTDG